MLPIASEDRQRIPTWLRLSIFAVIGICLAILALAAFLYFAQHSMIYHPRPYVGAYTRVLPTNGVELHYTLPFGKQTAFYIPLGNEPPRRVWVAFCGNGSLALDWTGLLPSYPKNGDAFLLVDYPGYGKNSGYASIDSTRATADTALRALADHLHVDLADVDLCVIGHSLGAAAALDFATRHPVKKIVVAAPFTTLREEAATVVGTTLSHLLIENYDNRESLREILKRDPRVRIAIFHGTNDEDIPIRMGRALAREFPAITYFEVAGADHGDVIDVARAQVIDWMVR